MNNENILNREIELFSTMSEAEEITADSELIDDLGISSMDILFLIASLEEEFKIKVSEKQMRRMVTAGDVADIIAELVG